jgi:hypothetical protein
VKKIIIWLLVAQVFVSCSTLTSKKNWVKSSDNISEEFTKSFSEIYPEMGSSLGYQEFDKLGMNLSKETERAEIALLKIWEKRLNKKLLRESSQNLKVDLLILLDRVQTDLEWKVVDEKLATISFYEASKVIYNSLFQLINKQSPKKRKKDAVSRFKYYMSNSGKSNLIDAYQSEIIRNQIKYKDRKKFYPFEGEVKKYLADSSSYIKGVKELLEKSGRTDWIKEYELFSVKIKKYDIFIKDKILPQARKQPNYPKDVYKLILKGAGVNTDPDSMIKIGKRDYSKIYGKFRIIAKKLSKKYNLTKSDPASVIKFLKSKQVSSIKEVSVLYNSASDRLEKIIRKNNLVSLPRKKLMIRFAGDAESKASPVPHLNPPPLIDNEGVLPEFVVPTSSSGKPPFDDFSYKSAATILTAHEGRPGHDLQFSKMLESPVSIVRARYAMNSVNVEGWALYAEDLVYPYLTDEEKMVAIQSRLWRIARYFLDPMVQLGKAKQSKVMQIFNNELGVSKVMAGLEYQRYAFRNPGQATAYYQGLLNILNIKKDFESEYGNLNLKCFNDTLLSFGLLPHKQIRLFKQQFQKCSE